MMTIEMTVSTAAKGRPKSEAKREQIFDAASELFPQYGFENVTMDMVAERAGVSKQTVYSHFDSKEALYSACISRKCIAHQLSPEFLDDERPVDAMLVEIGRRFLALLLSDEAVRIYRLSVGNAEQHRELAELFYRAGPEPTCRAVMDYLRRQHQRGTLDVPDPHTAACQFLYMLRADAVTRATLNIEPRPTAAQNEAYLQSCVAMFLRAYGVRR